MFLLFDIGGTKTRIAISRDKKTFEEPHISTTPKMFEEGMHTIFEVIKELTRGEKIEVVAGGAPGSFDREHTTLLAAPNLPDWEQKPLKQALQKELGAPVILENDAALAGLGEGAHGAGKGHYIVAYLTVGTGIGGVRIVRGRIDENAMGFEPGHQYINTSGKDLGELVSGSALKKRFGKDPREIHDPVVWEELARLLAYGLHNTIVHWSPDVTILGGSMMCGDPAIPLDRVAFHLNKILKIFSEPPLVVKAKRGDEGGLWGALIYARQKALF